MFKLILLCTLILCERLNTGDDVNNAVICITTFTHNNYDNK